MTKTVCDICGRELPTLKIVDHVEDLNFCISSYGRIWDICDDCRASLNKWMNTRRQEIGIDKLDNTNEEWLDRMNKIRAEIKQEYDRLSSTRADETLELGECLGLKKSLKFINNCIAESEVQE